MTWFAAALLAIGIWFILSQNPDLTPWQSRWWMALIGCVLIGIGLALIMRWAEALVAR